MVKHPVHRVSEVEVTGPYEIRVGFEDGTMQEIDLEPVLEGEIYRPLRDPDFFRQVSLDAEVRTIVWPNGADFDPSILHDWPKHAKAMKKMAQRWALAKAS